MNSDDDLISVSLSAEELRGVSALVEFRRTLMHLPPDEDSDEMKSLRGMTPEDLDAEARDLQECEYDHYAYALEYGGCDSGSTQFKRQYRLKLIKHVVGDMRFESVLAPINAKWHPILQDIHRRLDEPRDCRECGQPTVFEGLWETACADCDHGSLA